MKRPDPRDQPYVRPLRDLVDAHPGEVRLVTIHHDTVCPRLRGGLCTCQPELELLNRQQHRSQRKRRQGMSRSITCTVWLSQQRERPDPVGNLARDVARDRDCPIIAAKRHTYERSLRRRDVGRPVIAALHRAWAEFEADGSAAA